MTDLMTIVRMGAQTDIHQETEAVSKIAAEITIGTMSLMDHMASQRPVWTSIATTAMTKADPKVCTAIR